MNKLILSIIAPLLLVGCVGYDLSNKVVEQGNILSAKKIAKLHVGMAKQQVNTLLGTSLLTPDYESNQWDYAYTLRVKNDIKTKHLILYFKNDKLVSIVK